MVDSLVIDSTSIESALIESALIESASIESASIESAGSSLIAPGLSDPEPSDPRRPRAQAVSPDSHFRLSLARQPFSVVGTSDRVLVNLAPKSSH